MCITSDHANLSRTIVGGIADYRDGSHYLIYQNNMQDTSDDSVAGNCMILPINGTVIEFFDGTGLGKHFRNLATWLESDYGRISYRGAMRSSFETFKVGSYTIVASRGNDSDSIDKELSKLDNSIRPKIKKELLDWFNGHYEGYTLLFCCFNNREIVDAEPILVNFRPKYFNRFLLPMADGHDGGVPKQGRTHRDHDAIFGFIGHEEQGSQKYHSVTKYDWLNEASWLHLKSMKGATKSNFDLVMDRRDVWTLDGYSV